jgi:hypothetical protein
MISRCKSIDNDQQIYDELNWFCYNYIQNEIESLVAMIYHLD